VKKNKHAFNRLSLALTAALLLTTTGANAWNNAPAGQTTRVSVSSSGAQGNSDSTDSAISANGRYVAFSTNANNLVAGDTNSTTDVFVRDRLTGTSTRVSVSSEGKQIQTGSSGDFYPKISADGRYVAFSTNANNLVAGDTNSTTDGFVRDRVTGKTTRVSVSSEGKQGNDYSYIDGISADGRYVTFESGASNLVAGDSNGASDIFVHDRQTGKTTRVSISSAGNQGNDYSTYSAISADGRYIVFSSYADNLVAGDTNGTEDVFVRDRLTGTTARVSVNSAGVQGDSQSESPMISADGRYVAFHSYAENLATGDTNLASDIFVRDRLTGSTSRVSVSSTGAQAICVSWACNEAPVAISADGRYVAFKSYALNLVAGSTNGEFHVYVKDRQTGTTTRVSVSSTGLQGNYGNGFDGGISADGRYLSFNSLDDNMVASDTNRSWDVFIRDRLLNTSSVADLQATVTAKPASVKKGQTASYKLTITNNGPDSASNVAMTDIVTNGTVISITPSQGTCNKAAISVCRLGTLTAGANASIAVNIKADANPLTNQISVSASSKDNVPGNNAVNIYTTVTP